MSSLPPFIEPNPDPQDDDALTPTGDAAHPVLHIGRDTVEVVALAPPPALQTLPRHEASYLKTVNQALPHPIEADLIRSFSRAVADPAAGLEKLAAPLDWTGTAHGPVLSVKADLLALGTLPGPQPRGRTGQAYRSAAEPAIDHTDTGQPRMIFDDVDHYRRWLTNSIARTMERAIKRRRHLEVAATGVRRDVACHLAVLSFRDGTADQYVVLVRDGITRWTCEHILRRGLEGQAPADAAAAIVDELLPREKLAATTDSRALSKHLHSLASKVQAEYEANLTPDGPNERAVLLRQATRMPATTHLALASGGTGMAAAIDRIVADVHTDVELWSGEDADYHQARTVLEAMHDRGTLPDGVHELVEIPSAARPLQRAVSIAAYAMGEGFEEIKAEMRRQGMHSRVYSRRVTELLGPVLTEPWSQVKGVGNVWGYEGALPVLAAPLTPTHPANYLDLVEHALASNAAARDELRLAGGIALIAAGVVTTSLIGGSGASKGTSERMHLPTLFARLCETQEGLTQLAVAANTFVPDAANNPLPAVDMTATDRVKRDGAGTPVGSKGVGGLSAADLIALAKSAADPVEDDPEDDDPRPAAARELGEAVRTVERSVDQLTGALEVISRTRRDAGRTDPLMASEKAQEMAQALMRAALDVNLLSAPLVGK